MVTGCCRVGEEGKGVKAKGYMILCELIKENVLKLVVTMVAHMSEHTKHH